jgi:hypothetical protein
MKASELRIGNYFKGIRVGIVKSIFTTHFTVEDENGIQLGNSIQDNFQPIPLTEEWLLKFGFEKDEEYDNTFNRYISVFNGFTTITIDISANVLLLDNMEIKLHFVHQLQNLYFALTGEELTL